MPQLRPSTDVRPVTEFRASASAIIEHVRSTGRPLILTQHGRSAAVLLDPQVFEDLVAENELLRHLAISETQLAAGEVIAHEDVVRRIREKYGL